MKRWIHACTIILTLTSYGLAQSETPAQNDARELWLVRSQNITNDVLKDAGDLSAMQHAVLYVKLAQRWWRDDPKRATTWITNAIETVEQVPNKESGADREERLQTARVLLTIVTPLDQKFTKRLLTILTDNKLTENERFGVADALINAAVAIVKEDPKRAAELGALALRTGAPNNLDSLLFPLRSRCSRQFSQRRLPHRTNQSSSPQPHRRRIPACSVTSCLCLKPRPGLR